MIVRTAPSATISWNETRISSRSLLSDSIWHLDDLRPGRAASIFSLDWGFILHDGSAFDQPQWVAWCDAAKLFLWSLKHDPPRGRHKLSDGSLISYFNALRMLIRWMANEGYSRFAHLDGDASERFTAFIQSRHEQHSGKPLSGRTSSRYHNLLRVLYLQGAKFPAVSITEPFPEPRYPWSGVSRGWPHTPDEIAVPLVAGALRLIETPASDVIELQSRAQAAYNDGLAAHIEKSRVRSAAIHAVTGFTFSTLPGENAPWQTSPIRSTRKIRKLIDIIYDACFIVISYLIGARVSEILGLRHGCIEHHASADGAENFAYVVGKIYKTARGRKGDTHRWIAPMPVQRAIEVMERLSAPLRELSGRSELFLTCASTGLLSSTTRVRLPVAQVIVARLNDCFAPFINLPEYQGEPWHLTTHQGRKSFARFVGKRDRTGLHALKRHLGHVTRGMTDRGYVGTDFALDELIDSHTQDEMRDALEELLTAATLGGKGGRMIASRSQFRGRTRDGNVRSYVDFLLKETDLRLGVCDWGYCVYRAETSACVGNEKGPNPALRTQSTCISCANFAVTLKHWPIWVDRRVRNAALLDEPNLDAVSRRIVMDRIAECDRILLELKEGGEVRHGP